MHRKSYQVEVDGKELEFVQQQLNVKQQMHVLRLLGKIGIPDLLEGRLSIEKLVTGLSEKELLTEFLAVILTGKYGHYAGWEERQQAMEWMLGDQLAEVLADFLDSNSKWVKKLADSLGIGKMWDRAAEKVAKNDSPQVITGALSK